MPRFMGFVKMEEGIGAPPQALFDAMDTYINGRFRVTSSTGAVCSAPRTP